MWSLALWGFVNPSCVPQAATGPEQGLELSWCLSPLLGHRGSGPPQICFEGDGLTGFRDIPGGLAAHVE